MIGSNKVLAVIPARRGSVRLPGKNLADISGKPMLAWTVEAAKGSCYIDTIALSTDDEAIMRVGFAHGIHVGIRRPAELSGPQATSAAVVLHAMGMLAPHDLIVLLQPTSPLRTAQDIDTTIGASVGHTSCLTISQGVLNGAVYVVNARNFINDPQFMTGQTRMVDMPLSRSVDVDTPEDLKRARELMEARLASAKEPSVHSLMGA